MQQILSVLSDRRRLPLFLAGISILTLAIVYTAEYGFNLLPCPLCLYQRKPYIAVILFAAIAYAAAKRKPKYADIAIWLCFLSFVTGMGISGFHSGVELGWWEGLKSCGDVTLPVGGSAADLKKYLIDRPIVDCRVAGGRFLGISMTGYNFILSSLLAVVTGFFARRMPARNQ